jgi:hypothetical protein
LVLVALAGLLPLVVVPLVARAAILFLPQLRQPEVGNLLAVTQAQARRAALEVEVVVGAAAVLLREDPETKVVFPR